jgi:putative toxin-antitoxin system antitoxin component (TIGR02293 family)
MITLATLLGLPLAPANGMAWHDLIQEGLLLHSAEVLAEYLGMTVPALNVELRMSTTTDGVSCSDSDKLYRVALALRQSMVASRGSVTKAVAWLKTPNAALRNRVPLGLLATNIGSEFVMTAIERSKPTVKELAEKQVDAAEED